MGLTSIETRGNRGISRHVEGSFPAWMFGLAAIFFFLVCHARFLLHISILAIRVYLVLRIYVLHHSNQLLRRDMIAL